MFTLDERREAGHRCCTFTGYHNMFNNIYVCGDERLCEEYPGKLYEKA